MCGGGDLNPFKAVDNAVNAVSKAVGTDGGNKGILQGSLQGTSDAVSNLGKSVAENPLAQAAISAGVAWISNGTVPPSLTAALLGANSAGQKGDLGAGLKTGLISYGIGKGVNGLMTTTNVPTGTLDQALPMDQVRAVSGSAGKTAIQTVSETLGDVGSSITKRLGSIYDSVSTGDFTKAAGQAWDGAKSAGNAVLDAVAPASEVDPATGKIIKAARDYAPLMMGLQAVGGAYSSGQARDAAATSNQNRLDQINLQNSNAQADKAAYNASFNYDRSNEIKPTANGPLLRADGRPLYLPGGLINTASRRPRAQGVA